MADDTGLNTLGSEDATESKDARFAVIVPVGPSPIDVARAVALVRQLLFFEPSVPWCIILDDALEPRGLSSISLFPSSCQVVTVLNPRRGHGIGQTGGLCCGMLAAFAWVHANTDADFIVKIDTDALVIRPFSTAIRQCLARLPDAGIIGVVGESCNPNVRALRNMRDKADILKLDEMFPPASVLEFADATISSLHVPRFGRVPAATLRSFDAIRPHIDAARRNGFESVEFCQGGAYAMTRRMIDRMADAGYYDQPEVWADIPIGEDFAMAMYARAVGVHLYDCCRDGEPFGVQMRALPYPLEELVKRGYSIIHSIKNDGRYTEAEIRGYFAHASAR